ncbi:protein stoned-B isoform X1 [Danaus plexippus]|uniref:protein stoned-B isoform X1 n=1 Tax=Danaus plexippus TaxID=13037 RepID=UPI002AB054AB|nr:protein stoned-B isoform X1 [Danaus plexippus]
MVDCDYSTETKADEAQSATHPLPPETQNLILTVTGQMEFTSSHLLDRIPPTRTPSPVSVRDIHSPSPTPEPYLFEDNTSTTQTVNKPTRPPPVRPPRPAPPPRPQPPVQAPVQTAPDDINLFDAPVPTTIKPTKEAILSLYSAPKKEEKQIDFLSDDILELSNETDMQPTEGFGQPAKNSQTSEATHLLFNDSVSSISDNINHSEVQKSLFESDNINPNEDTNVAMDCTDLSEKNVNVSATNTSPFADMSDTNFQTQQGENEKNPFELSGVIDNNSPFATSDLMNSEILTEPADIVMTSSHKQLINDELHIVTTTEPKKAPEQQMNEVNVFAAMATDDFVEKSNIFASVPQETTSHNDENISSSNTNWGTTEKMETAFPETQDDFDAFSAKFECAGGNQMNTDAWGDDSSADLAPGGFEAEAFDSFLSMDAPPAPAATPRLDHQESKDSMDDTFSVFIRPKEGEFSTNEASVPVLAPPPRPQVLPESPRANPFDKNETIGMQQRIDFDEAAQKPDGSGAETPPTPLFDEDVSVPLEDFPRTKYAGPGWEMHLRQPNKKKITGQRFWKKVFVRLANPGDSPVVQLLNSATDKQPLQELPLQACYSVSEVGAQQFDQFGKIFTVKLQYVFYKERPGVRPGQVTKAERITNKLSQFAAYAIQGDYQGVKEFGSDLRKLGLPVEHAPQVTQLFKLGSLDYEAVKQFSCCVEEALFRLSAHRDRALTYKMEEVQLTAVDELYVEQDAEGAVLKQIARVRLFFLGFLSGMPDIELGVNDLRRQGKEVVGRHDIIPVATEEWIRVEDVEFHACVQPQQFQDTQIIKFKPPDACYIELMRFRVRPPKNRELPLQLKAVWCVTGNKVELRADVLVPGFASRALGQVPCEDVAARFPIPECWIYLFRVEKHFRYGSVKSAHRRTGKIKGIERFLGAVDTPQESLIEVTSGQAKYEHQHRAIVWRMPRLPKEGQGAYTTHNLVCRMALTSYDQIPAELARWAFVEFTMPATQVSHMVVRSVSLQDHDGDPPEKYVRYLARHEYKVAIERTTGAPTAAYALAAAKDTAPASPAAAADPAPPQEPSSDSDSD